MPIIRDIWGTTYVRAGIFHPSAFYKFVQNFGCLGFIIICILGLSWGLSKTSDMATSVIAPSPALLDNYIYTYSLREKPEIALETIRQKENEYWNNLLAGQGIYKIETKLKSVDNDILKKRNINDYDFWYKDDKHSEMQLTFMLVTTPMNQYDQVISDENFQQIEIKRCFRILFDMKYERQGMFMKYQYDIKELSIFDSNVDKDYVVNTKKYNR